MSKILVCDDSGFIRGMYKSILQPHGHEIIEAGNGIEAVEHFKGSKPDLVLLDITMPVMDGVDAFQNMIDHDKDAKVIFCSAMGQSAMIIDAIKMGAKDFIAKPFRKETVIETVNRVLAIV